MANNRFNKQVTPKGYKMGGKVMGDRVGFDKGMGVKETGFKHKGKLKKLYKEIVGRDRKFRDPKDALMALTKADAGATFIKGLEKKGINWSKMKDDILKEKMKSTEFRIGTAKGKSKASDDDEKKYRVYKKGGRVARKMGGSLKAVPADNKGLKKLPTKVRNKMGFMKKGGVVSDTKKKQFKANQAGQKATNKKFFDRSGLNLKRGAEGYINLGKKIARKFKGDK